MKEGVFFHPLLHLRKLTPINPPAKVAVFTCALDVMQTETEGTVLIKNADEMLNFTGGEVYLQKVQRFLTFSFSFSIFSLCFPKTESADRQCIYTHFADNQRNSYLQQQSHHRPPLHRRPQSPLQIRAPPPLPRRQR